MKLVEVGESALKCFLAQIHQQERDVGWELTLTSDSFQFSFVLNFFDEMSLFLKIYQHKNVLREGVYRFEAFMAGVGDMRGTRIACVEFLKEKDLHTDIQTFIEGILLRTGLKKT